MSKIFIIEDEQAIIELVKYNLEKEGYRVSYSNKGDSGISEIKQIEPDLILIDWMLPDISGIEVCKILKKDKKLSSIPVIMLTAKGEEEDKIRGFDSGADDYMTKPFSHLELKARINAILRRSKAESFKDEIIYKDLKINRIERKVFRGNQTINLGPTEYNLLNFLIDNPKRVYSREQLLNNVWRDNVNVEERTIDVHVRKLRQAINIKDATPLIRTARSAGYALDS
jgi:two-component system phosphate regulon response regulator PhoB